MGSTPQDYDKPTLNPIRHLVNTGRFAEAKRQLDGLRGSTFDIEVTVLRDICDYRLNDERAIKLLRQLYPSKITPELEALISYHEILGLIAHTRFDAAQTLLYERVPQGTADRDALAFIALALRQLKDGQQTRGKIQSHPGYRAGFKPPRVLRESYLSEARDKCVKAQDRTKSLDSDNSKLLYALSCHVQLLIEMMMPGAHDNVRIRALRSELAAFGSDFKDATKAHYRLKTFKHMF